jgi:hypothetical protein
MSLLQQQTYQVLISEKWPYGQPRSKPKSATFVALLIMNNKLVQKKTQLEN